MRGFTIDGALNGMYRLAPSTFLYSVLPYQYNNINGSVIYNGGPFWYAFSGDPYGAYIRAQGPNGGDPIGQYNDNYYSQYGQADWCAESSSST